MIMYNVDYKSNNVIKTVSVVAESITHALNLVDTMNANNIFYNGIVDCRFVQKIDVLLIEQTD